MPQISTGDADITSRAARPGRWRALRASRSVGRWATSPWSEPLSRTPWDASRVPHGHTSENVARVVSRSRARRRKRFASPPITRPRRRTKAVASKDGSSVTVKGRRGDCDRPTTSTSGRYHHRNRSQSAPAYSRSSRHGHRGAMRSGSRWRPRPMLSDDRRRGPQARDHAAGAHRFVGDLRRRPYAEGAPVRVPVIASRPL